MRKKKREQIVSLLQCYKEAHYTIRKGIEEGRSEEAISLLALCQEGMEKIEQDTEKELDGKAEREALFASYQEALYFSYLSLIKKEEERREEDVDSPTLYSEQVSCEKRAISRFIKKDYDTGRRGDFCTSCSISHPYNLLTS